MEDKEVKNINNNEVKKEEKKKSGKLSTIIVTLMVVAAAGLLGYKVWNSVRPLSSYINDKADRNFIYIDAEQEKKKLDKSAEVHYKPGGEIDHVPYKESSGGGMSVWVSGTGVVTINDLIQDGKAKAVMSGLSLKTKEDERVSQNEVYNFNQYVSYRKIMDSVSNDKLSKEQVNAYAETLKSLAKSENHPAWIFIDKLINNLEEKNPTKASLIYLSLANGLSNEGVANVFDINLGYVNNYSNLLDRSYKPNQEKSLTLEYSGNLEVIDKETVIAHSNTDSSYTYYAIVDSVKGYYNIYPTDKSLEKDIVVGICHYKNVSNNFLSEFYTIILNKDTSDNGINRAYYTKTKPAFTWCISPKIEEIASAYYDIVEPAVYAGRYTNFEDAYKSTYDALEGKYTLEEIESAVMTYEFWALCNYN